MTETPSGLLVVDKPAGCTSHDVVDQVRKIYQMSKVGHSGTLDPDATGVLLLALGKATRLAPFLQNLPKSYRAEAKFGVSTSTQDSSGEVVATKPSSLTVADVEAMTAQFEGEIQQIPPMVSAVKIDGEPLYKAARRGEEVDRPARTVRTYELLVDRFDETAQTARIFVKCSSGTFIRTLVSDIGDRLGVGGHVTSIRRLSIGSFTEADVLDLRELERSSLEGCIAKLLTMRQAMRDFPEVTVEGDELAAVTHGRPIAGIGQAKPKPQEAEVPTIRGTPLPQFLPGPGTEPAGLGLGMAGGLMPTRSGELPLMAQPRPGDRPAHEAGMTAGVPVAVLDLEGNLIAVYRRSKKGLMPAAVLVG
ncbi:MAG: tRNA pseudouridine(55) synthase TruB [Actinomycetota bacterium]